MGTCYIEVNDELHTWFCNGVFVRNGLVMLRDTYFGGGKWLLLIESSDLPEGDNYSMELVLRERGEPFLKPLRDT